MSIPRHPNEISVDLWELPQPLSTDAITEKTEINFYSRCPPEKRPRFMKETQIHDNVSPTISQISSNSPRKHTTGNTQNEKQEYDPDIEKVCRNHLQTTGMKFDWCNLSDRHYNRSRKRCRNYLWIMASRQPGKTPARGLVFFPAALGRTKNQNTTNPSSKLS